MVEDRLWPCPTAEVVQGEAPMQTKGGYREGFSWLLAEPLPRYPPGTKVSMPDNYLQITVDSPTGARSALVTIDSEVVRVCEVADRGAKDFRDRCSSWPRQQMLPPRNEGDSTEVVSNASEKENGDSTRGFKPPPGLPAPGLTTPT
jgi:hypothetical protein